MEDQLQLDLRIPHPAHRSRKRYPRTMKLILTSLKRNRRHLGRHRAAVPLNPKHHHHLPPTTSHCHPSFLPLVLARHSRPLAFAPQQRHLRCAPLSEGLLREFDAAVAQAAVDFAVH